MKEEDLSDFRNWILAASQHTWGYDDLWEAAQDRQREKDAVLCEELFFNACATLIRNNK